MQLETHVTETRSEVDAVDAEHPIDLSEFLQAKATNIESLELPLAAAVNLLASVATLPQ